VNELSRTTAHKKGFFAQLLDLLLPKGGYIVTLYPVYIDESYTNHEDTKRGEPPIFVVGGYALEKSQAVLMDAEWRKVLQEFWVDHFHMKEVAPCKGDCFGWLGMELCDEMSRAMHALINKYVLFGYAVVLNPEKPWFNPNVPTDQYAFALRNCVHDMCSEIYRRDPAVEYVEFFLEKGHSTSGIAHEVLDGMESIQVLPKKSLPFGHSFKPKKEIPLLQAGDILAWHSRKYFLDRYLKNKRKPRLDFQEIMKSGSIRY
jgi:Protein of unknown function (DUF3800)